MLSKTHSKYIQSLHHKKSRDADNVFIAEGNKVVPELVQSKQFVCIEILGTKEWLQQHEVFLRKYYNGPLQEVESFELEKISALSTPNQVLAIFKKAAPVAIEVKGKISLVLDTIQDPGNLGTIIRIADWFGIQNIICSNNSTEMYNPKVVQSTMGSLGRVDIIYTDIAEWLQEHNEIRVYAAALDGKPVQQCKGIKEGLIIIGNESKGISKEILELVNEKITIPKIGEAESLNAAVATGIILSHIV
ncbi:MAG: RNA methyltransferase [Chitinophagaceae bacterium]|nr:RNA methyltransferase [Chitinophagaceae bacterium]